MRRALTLTLVILAALALPGSALGGAIEREIKSTLVGALPWDPGQVEITGIKLQGFDPDSSDLDYDSVEVTLPRRLPRMGRVSVYLGLFSGSREVKNLWATARVNVYRDAVIAAKPLEMGETISRSDVKVERVRMRRVSGEVASVDEVIGMRVRRPIGAGSVVKEAYVEPSTLIKRGDSITLVVTNGVLKVKSIAVASEDGHKGGTITAVTSSGKEVTGRVVGPGEMQVRF